ncbi:MAG: ABC transporter permease [Chloroflexi bacterium]|nr:ABC transporter permease [Chloroflexota bacterium]
MVSSIQESVAPKPAAGADVALPRRPGLLTRMRASRRLMIGAAVFVLMVVAAVIGPTVAPHDPLEINPRLTLRTFAPGYLLGTDEFGRDLLSRMIYGARPTLTVAIGATTIALVLGTLCGMVAGYLRGLLDQLIMRSLDTLLSFPPILLAMMVVGFLGPGVRNLVIVIGVLFVPTFARLAYAETLRIKELEYVSAARALGATSPRMLMQHILPNITAPLIVQFSLAMAAAILLESGLSFLGLGVVPPESSWGLMIAGARNYMAQAPNYVLWPALVIAATILAINTAGDALRDLLDPRLRY